RLSYKEADERWKEVEWLNTAGQKLQASQDLRPGTVTKILSYTDRDRGATDIQFRLDSATGGASQVTLVYATLDQIGGACPAQDTNATRVNHVARCLAGKPAIPGGSSAACSAYVPQPLRRR
ncbi:hypothetical protein ACFL2M_01780, partial [Patescibacteria group bacterium]